MNKDTVQKYNVDLQELGLLRLLSNGVKLTPDNLLWRDTDKSLTAKFL